MTPDAPLELLLATYNSETYLAELLESLAKQTHDDFVLVVSDDGSIDATLAIIQEQSSHFRHPIRLAHAPTPTGSAMGNFAHLLSQSSADYVMLVDHDDLWHPNKIASGLHMIRAAEARLGKDRPALAHSDLRPVNGALEQIAPSFWSMKQIDPSFSLSLRRTLIHASVVGCTSTMNRALVKASLPIPAEAVMHDWWISLIAAATGTVVYDEDARIDYRIHGRNVSNPTQVNAASALKRSNYFEVMRQKIDIRARQARALSTRLEPDYPDAAAIARAFGAIPDQGFLQRRYSIFRGGFVFPGVWRNLALTVAA